MEHLQHLTDPRLHPMATQVPDPLTVHMACLFRSQLARMEVLTSSMVCPKQGFKD